MHDAITGDRLGVPSAGIMTEKFVSAAALMSEVLGAAGHPFVVVPHPISSASATALAAAAKAAAADCVAIIVGDQTAADVLGPGPGGR